MNRVVHFDTEQTDSEDAQANIDEAEEADELDGKLKPESSQEKLMRSVLENDKEHIEEGKLLSDSINKGMGSFTPDLMIEQMVKNYSNAERLFGESIIRAFTGYDPDYVKKNIKIPEFQRQIKENINEKTQHMKEEGYIDKEGIITDSGIEIASLALYAEELQDLETKGFLGERKTKDPFIYGEQHDNRRYRTGDRYKDIAIKKSVKLALRRGHDKLHEEDLEVHERESKGTHYIIYGIDASGSMKGKKIETAKKSGIALAYKAISERDKVGLLVFGSEVKTEIAPTDDFPSLLRQITQIRSSSETNIAETIKRSAELFPDKKVVKHLLLLTDAIPTVGDDPEKLSLEATSIARSSGITISLIGIGLDDDGLKLARQIVEIGQGILYSAKNLEEIDKIVLEDYMNMAR